MAAAGVAIIGFSSDQNAHRAQSQQISEVTGVKIALQSYIEKGLDCETTITSMKSTCKPDVAIELASLSTDNPILIMKPVKKQTGLVYQSLGEYSVVATCEECSRGEGCPKGHKIVIKAGPTGGTRTDIYAPDRLLTCDVPF